LGANPVEVVLITLQYGMSRVKRAFSEKACFPNQPTKYPTNQPTQPCGERN